MNCGIYRIYWDCGYFYYGQTVNFYNRRKGHLSLLRKGKHENDKLLNVYKKYGSPYVELLFICKRNELTFYEQVLLDSAVGNRKCCNNNFDASGTTIADSTKMKLSALMTGRKLSESHSKNISAGLKGKRTGSKHPFFGKTNPFAGKRHSEETRKIMSKKSNKVGANNGRARLVINLQTGVFYDCVVDAAKAHNINPSTMYNKLHGYKKNNTSIIFA